MLLLRAFVLLFFHEFGVIAGGLRALVAVLETSLGIASRAPVVAPAALAL